MSDGISDMMIELEYLKENIWAIEWDGVDHADYPDYCDAFISSARIDERQLDWNELDLINNDSDFIHEKLMEHIC